MNKKYKLTIIGTTAAILLCSLVLWKGFSWGTGRRWQSGYYESPLWSPDGSRILYLYSNDSAEPSWLAVVGKNDFPLSKADDIFIPARYLSAPGWRSDTEISVFDRSIPGRGTHWSANPATLYLYNLASGELNSFQAPLPIARDIAWHPYGQQALVSFRNFPPFTSPTEPPLGIYKFTPDTEQFELWRIAEWPGAISWSPDGRYVAYTDVVTVPNTNPEEKVVELNVIEFDTNSLIVSLSLSGTQASQRWSSGDSNMKLAWSPDGKHLFLPVTLIENYNTRNYGVLSGLALFSITDVTKFDFWQLSFRPTSFDWSPSGDEIIVTTVSGPYSGKNQIWLLEVPENFR